MYKHLALALLLLLITACEEKVDDSIDLLFADYAGDNPGLAFMVAKNGEIIDQRCYGLADLENRLPVTDKTNFRLASVSKQFTAMAILRLMDQRYLGFETRLREIFPEFPAYADDITFGHLLHHTSGLVDYEDLIPDSATIPVKDLDVLALLLTQDTTRFPPGSDYAYNNGGYSLLALTVERLTEQTFPDHLKHTLFDPLGMHNSVAYDASTNSVSDRAFGYHVDSLGIHESDQSMTSSVLGDGGIYSSISDFILWDRALNADTLLSPAYSDSMFSPWKNDYACGWRIETVSGRTRISHTGSTCGFRSVYQRYPEDSLSVLILCNRREPGVQYLGDALTQLYARSPSID